MAIDIFLVHGPVFGLLLAGAAIVVFVLLALRFARAGGVGLFGTTLVAAVAVVLLGQR